RNPEIFAEEELSSGGAEADHHIRPNDFELGFQPRLARRDVSRARLLVKTFGPTRLPAKVFDYVRKIDFATVNACLFERGIQQPSSRADEGLPFDVLLIPRHLTNEHHRCAARPNTEDGLSPLFVEFTT